jgi:hypothetical protein
MSDGISEMYKEEYERKHKAAIEKLSAKGYEQIYLSLKDMQSDMQILYHDEKMQLARNQWAAFNRINQALKELL